jgi:hypothetical protein
MMCYVAERRNWRKEESQLGRYFTLNSIAVGAMMQKKVFFRSPIRMLEPKRVWKRGKSGRVKRTMEEAATPKKR